MSIDNYTLIYSRGIQYPKESGIYCIKNTINGKVYIGSAFDLDKRIKNHIWGIGNNSHRNIILKQAFNKYGAESFYFIVLETCDKKDLKEREQLWLDTYKSYLKENGYNIQPFAYSNKSNKLSEETKRKISNYQKGKPKSSEANLKNSLAHRGRLNPNYGKPISEKLRLAIIESNNRRFKNKLN